MYNDLSTPAKISASVEKRSAKSLFHYRRLDLIVKYLFIRNILKKRQNDAVASLYMRHILMRSGGHEQPDALSLVEKHTLAEYTESLSLLLDSIAYKGFDPACAVPVASSGLLHNGAHRIACCQALEQDISVYNAGGSGYAWDFAWFCKNGFTLDDKLRILKGFADIHPENSAIMLVWQPVREHLEQIKTIIAASLNIVGEVELSFEHHYIAFSNVLLEIYAHSNQAYGKAEGDDTIAAKAELLRAWPLTISVLLLTDQDRSQDKDIHAVVAALKSRIRQYLAHIIPENIFGTLHASASVEECRHLAAVLLSPNNLRHLHMRMLIGVKPRFLALCAEAKEALARHGIPQDSACAVGSGGLGIFAMEDDGSDMDLVLTAKARERFGKASATISDNVDLAHANYCSKIQTRYNSLSDDRIIEDNDCHFLFNGLKFLNLELVKQRKNVDRSDKDLAHIRKIELLENLSGYYDHQRSIRWNIETEQKRRARSLLSLERMQEQIEDLQAVSEGIMTHYTRKLICLAIRPIVKRRTKATNFRTFETRPAKFFASQKSPLYRLFGLIVFGRAPKGKKRP